MPLYSLVCKYCSQNFEKELFPSLIERGGGQYCSRACRAGSKKVDTVSRKCLECSMEFETKQYLLASGRGKFCGKVCRSLNNYRLNTEFSESKRPAGKNHHNWKGDDVSYVGLHMWVARHLGKPKLCSSCGTTDENLRYDWANISHEYQRDLCDWIRLCRKCHADFDKPIKTLPDRDSHSGRFTKNLA